ncbi:TolC family protein [Mucilaginibacter sp. OK283]|jgi:outer membrane protein|uniref:TolC family protein n=1 Tax=Mucilaginibacter sp. OK283 TaxID=1881049 RepID=UPI0008AF5F56|nr:TolC family protein [Mucilaginibacter sp. OK283]SEP15418.1 outer membrane protein [Mucilaginibacter sp. OK283]
MRYFKFIFLGLIALSATRVQAQTDSVLSIRQCVDIAIKNNLDVKKSELQMERLQVGYNQAKEYLLPAINGSVNHGINNGRNINPFTNSYVTQSLTYGNYSLNGSLTLFSGMQNLNNIKQTSLSYQAGKMDFQQAKDQVTINVITAYLLVLDNAELLGQVTNQLEVSKKQVERLDILEKEGANKLPSDLYDLKGTLGDNQLNVVSAKNALEVSKLNLMQMLNIPYNRNLKLEPLTVQDVSAKTDASSDQVYDAALQQLAYIKAAELRSKSAEKGVKVAQGALLPTLSLGAGIFTNYSSAAQSSTFIDSTTVNTGAFVNGAGGTKQAVYSTQANYSNHSIGYYDQFKNNYSTQVSLNLQIPILNYFQNRNKVKLAKINLEEAKFVESNSKIVLKQNVEQAYLNMTSAYERYTVLSDQVKAYTESFRIAEIRFNNGVLTSYDFVLAKNNLDRSKINMINARYDCFIYNKILDYYQGKLTL